MELACEEVVPNLGCDFVATGDTPEEVHAAMMAHGAATHSDLMEGKSAEEMQRAHAQMDGHIRNLIAEKAS